jgi:hypothetical protein
MARVVCEVPGTGRAVLEDGLFIQVLRPSSTLAISHLIDTFR